MKEFDYVIIGGGCAGLSLAYELDLHEKLNEKTLAIVEPRTEYRRDKTWSFWKVSSHNFEDCVRKSWNKFNIRIDGARGTQVNECTRYPYQSVDSGLFYKKINDKLKENKNIKFFKNIKELDVNNSFVFNSVPTLQAGSSNLWQHFYGFEIETDKDCFNENNICLMDFCCDQRNNVHFFYILPFTKKKALIETTWISKNDNSSLKDYESQIKNYIKDQPFSNTGNMVENYKINFKEEGAIPLFYPYEKKEKNKINIGTAGGMTRLSTGYTFLNIQEHSKYIRMNIENIEKAKKYKLKNKYKVLDKIFLKVLEKNPEKMPDIFYKIFDRNTDNAIKFLSNRSSFIEDMSVILKMPKWIFIKALFGK